MKIIIISNGDPQDRMKAETSGTATNPLDGIPQVLFDYSQYKGGGKFSAHVDGDQFGFDDGEPLATLEFYWTDGEDA